MQNILIVGSGRSSASLINYLLANAEKEEWHITIAEKDVTLAEAKINGHPKATAVYFDILDEQNANDVIDQHDLIISMLPAALHIHVAKKCGEKGKHMLTASYLTPEIRELNDQFKDNGKLLVMEMGLDPGLDHMSAMKVLDRIKKNGNELTSFETFTGGLLYDDKEKNNPWQYKFTWNPRNVVLAGQDFVKFIQEGRYKYIPYQKLFKRTEIIHIPGYGYFEGYANRDSLKYLDLYNLTGINTLFRGTLRRTGFCRAWDVFVQLGATDDSFEMENVSQMTHRQFLNSFLSYNPHDSVELKLAHYMNMEMESDIMYKIKWIGMFDDESVGLEKGTPAQILEHILKKKWTLDKEDRDMIVMWHKFDYMEGGAPKQIQSHMVVIGDDDIYTAMSKTVGLPLAITAKLVIQGRINLSGVHIPVKKEIYKPVLTELEHIGFEFSEREIEV